MGRQYLPGGDENEVVSDWHAVITCRPAVTCFGIGGRRRLSCDVGGQPGAFPEAAVSAALFRVSAGQVICGEM